MRHSKSFLIALCLLFINLGLASSQEDAAVKEKLVKATEAEPEIQWVWAEVVSVNIEKNEVKIKYFNYETDEEKEIDIAVDNKTTYENIKSINELKIGDTLSIDYVVSPEGKDIARNISVEKPEASLSGPEKIAPEKMEPAPEAAPNP
ncbi:MAG: hypothetical protein PHQ57_02270 [Candidatus Omnitrophica bacterium]|nr:hypothetical protein [Candidatus Omnitrophota bacterium]